MGTGAHRVASGKRVSGSLRVPPSKSVTQRYLALALLSRRPVTLEHPLVADDTRQFLAAMRALGWQTVEEAERFELTPGVLPTEAGIDCGHNGTMLRFLVAALATLPGEWRLDGSERLRQRPVGPLAEAMEQLGARVEWLVREGFAPLVVKGGSLEGGHTRLDAGLSSQFLSALLLAATRARAPVLIEVLAMTSTPYVELTLAAMADFGAKVERLEDRGFFVTPTELRGGTVAVEGDYSAAAYPAAAALVTGGEVELHGLEPGSRQGDRGFLEVLGRMGAEIEWQTEGVRVAAGSRLTAVDLDLSSMPDQVPTLAALAPFARGTTRIRNVPHLRLKESDRLAAMASELRKLGVEVTEIEDGLVIPGLWAETTPPEEQVIVDSHGDHRIAMSLALTGLRRPGVSVANSGVVAKSYPSFWSDLEGLLGA
ncbi:MAG: 3-phosphoshikimate 1-carboxyvinyltransferase [Thermoanaerobaculia bacterium]